MADIKFRAWDKLTEPMRYVLCIDWLNDLVDLNGGIIERKYNNSEEDEVILMQYTGLKDNIGKEIYEGDIISFGDNKAVVFYEHAKFKAKYRYYNNCYCYDALSDVLYFKKVEVIGNIYENKELIDEVQDD